MKWALLSADSLIPGFKNTKYHFSAFFFIARMSVATVSNSIINKNLYHMQKVCLTEISVDYHAVRYGTDSVLEPAAHRRVMK